MGKSRLARLLFVLVGLSLATALGPTGMPAPIALTDVHADGAPAVRGRLLAQTFLVAKQGGHLRASNGVELRVPPKVMERDGVAWISRLGGGRFDVHIAVPWRGTVTVLLPGRGRASSVAHRVGDRWTLEPATRVKGRIRVRVRSLSTFSADEPLRYAIETMEMAYPDFVARKKDFTKAGCNADHPKKGGCKKPAPYNAFNWTSDGCSGPWGIKEIYSDLFHDPCQMHDFGYRNFGNGLRLGRDEDTRHWIDIRFKEEMGRVCERSFSRLWQAANKLVCISEAGYAVTAVRHAGRPAFYGTDTTPAPQPAPAPAPPQPPAAPQGQPPAAPQPDPAPPGGRPPTPNPSPTPSPTPTPRPAPTPTPAPRTWPEQQGSLGANTFLNPHNASGMGVKIQPFQWVEVRCKVYAPQIVSANPDGYWYRIASPPWSDAYYAVANTFWNGDVPGQRPYTHNTDWAVPNC